MADEHQRDETLEESVERRTRIVVDQLRQLGLDLSDLDRFLSLTPVTVKTAESEALIRTLELLQGLENADATQRVMKACAAFFGLGTIQWREG